MQMKLILTALAAISLGLPSLAAAEAVIRSAGGDATPASITSARDQFRVDLGVAPWLARTAHSATHEEK